MSMCRTPLQNELEIHVMSMPLGKRGCSLLVRLNMGCNWCLKNNSHSYIPSSWKLFYLVFISYPFIYSRRLPIVEQDMPTLPEHLISPPVFSGVRVTRYLVLCVCFVDRCLSFCICSFVHCVVYTSSIYILVSSSSSCTWYSYLKITLW